MSKLTYLSKKYFPFQLTFKELRDRVAKFSGELSEDFDIWLADYCKATTDCGWTDALRARWFSWFLAGTAKHIWKHTLRREDKTQWNNILASYRSHYRVQIKPRTAYLHCRELQYGDFHSVQGLLEAMKDYQRMAPDQLSNDNLISILWNKVPIKLQKGVEEIKDWSLHELLHCLLRDEARVAERECRNTQTLESIMARNRLSPKVEKLLKLKRRVRLNLVRVGMSIRVIRLLLKWG